MNNLISYSHYPNLGDCFESKNPGLIDFINSLQSYLGIVDNELWFKMYDEYREHSSVYDMNHNNPILLKAQAIRLVKQCTCLTQSEETYLELIKSHIKPYLFTKTLYPVFPVENMDRLRSMYYKISPFLKPMSADEKQGIYQYWDKMNILLFYSDWYNLLNSERAVKTFYKERLGYLLYMVENKESALNVLARFADSLEDVSPEPKTSFIRKSISFLKKIFK